MNVKEFYGEIGGDYGEVLARLGKEERILKYLIRFTEGNPIADFEKALAENNFTECFRVLHSVKGICLNLGLSKLGSSSSELCEVYRNGPPTMDAKDLISKVKEDYETTVSAIGQLSSNQEGESSPVLEVSKERLLSILNTIVKNSEDLYIDGVDANIVELSKCMLPPKLQSSFAELKEACEQVQFKKISNDARSMIQQLSE